MWTSHVNARVLLLVALLVACKPVAKAEPDASALPAATVRAASVCIVVDAKDLTGGPVDLVGTVFTGTRGHPNGSSFDFVALRLAAPSCVKGLEDVKEVDEVHLAPKDDGASLRALASKKVRVTGTAFPEHTAWHVRPVVVDVASVTPL